MKSITKKKNIKSWRWSER